MTTYPPALLSHLDSDVTTVCRCWRLTRRDGAVSGFTDHDVPVTVDGTVCEPQTGFSASEAKQTLGLAADAIDVEGALSSANISAEDIGTGLLDGATVESYLVNWRSPQDHVRIGHALIGKIIRSDGRFVAELESRMRYLDQPNGRYILRRCDAELGDARCGFAAGPAHSGAGSVLSLSGPSSFIASGLAGFQPGWFTHGVLSWTSGNSAGRKARVAVHRKDGGQVTLGLFASDGSFAPGDGFSVSVGCDKSFATCKAKFSNALNFRGFPHLPGNDHAYSYATENGNFDGRPIVP